MSGSLDAIALVAAPVGGLPASAWLMIVAAGGLGLAVELVFYVRHRRRWAQERERPDEPERRAER